MKLLHKLISLATLSLSLAPLPAMATTFLYRGYGVMEFRNAGQAAARLPVEDVSITTGVDAPILSVIVLMDGGRRTIIYYQGDATRIDEKTWDFNIEVEKMFFDTQTSWPNGGGYRSDNGAISRPASGSCQIRYGRLGNSRINCWGRTSDGGVYNFQFKGDEGQVTQ